MLIPFNSLIFYPKKVKGIIHIGAHELEEMNDYLNRGVKKIIWVEANPEKYEFIKKTIKNYKSMKLAQIAAGSQEREVALNTFEFSIYRIFRTAPGVSTSLRTSVKTSLNFRFKSLSVCPKRQF